MPAEYRMDEACAYPLGEGARGNSDAPVGHLAWRLCSLNRWPIIDVHAEWDADTFEN